MLQTDKQIIRQSANIQLCLKIFTRTFSDVSEIFKFHFKIFISFLNCVTSSVAPSGASKLEKSVYKCEDI